MPLQLFLRKGTLMSEQTDYDIPLALVKACKTVEELSTLYPSAWDWEWSDEATDVAVKKILRDYGDDMFTLFQIAVDFDGNKERKKWSTTVCDRIFEEIMNQCKTLPTLILLYKSLPGAPEPGTDDNLHQKVVERMIEVAGKDTRKLFIIFRHLDTAAKGEFGLMVTNRIEELEKKK